MGDIRDIKLWRVTDAAKSKFVAFNVQVRRGVAKLKELHDQELILGLRWQSYKLPKCKYSAALYHTIKVYLLYVKTHAAWL